MIYGDSKYQVIACIQISCHILPPTSLLHFQSSYHAEIKKCFIFKESVVFYDFYKGELICVLTYIPHLCWPTCAGFIYIYIICYTTYAWTPVDAQLLFFNLIMGHFWVTVTVLCSILTAACCIMTMKGL